MTIKEALKKIVEAFNGTVTGKNIPGLLKDIITANGGTPTGKNIPSLINEISENVSGGSGTGGIEVTVADGVATGYSFELTIPDGVTEIGGEAFKDAKMSSIVFPEGLSNIGFSAFSGCTNLTEVALPSTLTSIAPNAFSGCTSLSSVTSLTINPPACAINSFNNTSDNLVIYVPAEVVDTYKAASGWSTYADKIQAITN